VEGVEDFPGVSDVGRAGLEPATNGLPNRGYCEFQLLLYFMFDDANEANRYLENSDQFGKIVVSVRSSARPQCQWVSAT
jgi:hypothetical protein